MRTVTKRTTKCVVCARGLLGRKSEIGELVCTKKCYIKLIAFVRKRVQQQRSVRTRFTRIPLDAYFEHPRTPQNRTGEKNEHGDK